MEKIFSVILILAVAAVFLFFGATIGGTIVWALWDNVIPVMFPGLVRSGAVASDPSWFSCVMFTWMVSVLISSGRASSSSSENSSKK